MGRHSVRCELDRFGKGCLGLREALLLPVGQTQRILGESKIRPLLHHLLQDSNGLRDLLLGQPQASCEIAARDIGFVEL